jgi:hypothetical protein
MWKTSVEYRRGKMLYQCYYKTSVTAKPVLSQLGTMNCGNLKRKNKKALQKWRAVQSLVRLGG